MRLSVGSDRYVVSDDISVIAMERQPSDPIKGLIPALIISLLTQAGADMASG